jgi:hypothetical protein
LVRRHGYHQKNAYPTPKKPSLGIGFANSQQRSK